MSGRDTGPVPEAFVEMLSGGHPNSLGRTEEVVGLVLADGSRLEQLFGCLESPDAVVRMRAADALEKVCRERPEWFEPRVERLLEEVGAIDQPSVQWHTAQMLGHLYPRLDSDQGRRAGALLRRYLTESDDWIVLNVTMEILAEWSRDRADLAAWLLPELERLRADERKSVAKRATKLHAKLAD
jgi:HEAT repeat protein